MSESQCKATNESEIPPVDQHFPLLPSAARAAMMILPLVGLAVILFVVYLMQSSRGVTFLLVTGLGGFIGAGKLVIFAGLAENAPVGVWGLAGLVVYNDLLVALIILANMQYLYRLPWAGKRLAQLRAAGCRVLEANPWMRRGTFLGVAVFVAVPFQGTGSILGVILARILGISRVSAVGAIVVGSVTGCMAMALLASYGRERIAALAANPLLGLASISVVLIAAYLLGRRFTGGDADE